MMIARTLLRVPMDATETRAADYSQVRFSHGAGRLIRGGVSLTRGVTARIEVEFRMQTILERSMREWVEHNRRLFSDEQYHTLEEGFRAGGMLGGLLCGAFGFLFGGGAYHHFRNSTDRQIQIETVDKQGAIRELHDISREEVSVRGTLEATGIDREPVEGWIFAEATSIEFSDGHVTNVLSASKPYVADQSGDTARIITPPNQRLQFVPTQPAAHRIAITPQSS